MALSRITGAAALSITLLLPQLGAAAAKPEATSETAAKKEAASSPAAKTAPPTPGQKPAPRGEPSGGQNSGQSAEEPATGFTCAAVSALSSTEIKAYGVRISGLRARAVPGIAGSFNLFEVSYRVQNDSPAKIWVSGEFVFGFSGNLAGALSASTGLNGVLPGEAETVKGNVISNNVFFQTQNFCYRFNVEQQQS